MLKIKDKDEGNVDVVDSIELVERGSYVALEINGIGVIAIYSNGEMYRGGEIIGKWK